MPDAVSFIVTTYTKLAKGETGTPYMSSRRLAADQALDWILNEFPEEARKYEPLPGGAERITIDWSKVPDSIRSPELPARRR